MEIKGNQGGTEMNVQFGTKGSSKAIHIVHMYKGSMVTVCPAFSIYNSGKEGLHPVAAEAATCKSCIKISQFMGVSA
jgi:hypothetical protein